MLDCNKNSMNKSILSLGVAGVVIPFLFIALAIATTSWFNIFDNALSDLGSYARNGYNALIFNIGLILGGLIIFVFSTAGIITEKLENKIWMLSLWVTAIFLSMIGFFSEDFGYIHLFFSVAFFFMLTATFALFAVFYDALGLRILSAFLAILSTFTLIYPWPWKGVAIQELIPSFLGLIWFLSYAFEEFFRKK